MVPPHVHPSDPQHRGSLQWKLQAGWSVAKYKSKFSKPHKYTKDLKCECYWTLHTVYSDCGNSVYCMYGHLTWSPCSCRLSTVSFLMSPVDGATCTLNGESGMCWSLNLTDTRYSPECGRKTVHGLCQGHISHWHSLLSTHNLIAFPYRVQCSCTPHRMSRPSCPGSLSLPWMGPPLRSTNHQHQPHVCICWNGLQMTTTHDQHFHWLLPSPTPPQTKLMASSTTEQFQLPI